MRIVVQRVSRAGVSVEGRVAGEIGRGLVLLVSAGKGDQEEDARRLAHKIVNLRVFPDEAGKMNRSLLDTGGELLVISNFTLHADCRKGCRPSFFDAQEPVAAQILFDRFLEFLKEQGASRVETGVFGALMQVELVNDGPVTIWLDSAAGTRP